MLPSAAGFVDPLFSTGMPLTLLGVERIARALEAGAFPGEGSGVAEYERVTLAEADHTARFIDGCYAAFPRFEQFAAFSMFYFAAASFSEMSRRLKKPSPGFLFADDPAFVEAMAATSPASRSLASHPSAGDQAHVIAAAVERLNVAGLCDPAKRNWYGVDLEDAVRGAAKLGVTPDAVTALLEAVSMG